MRHALLGLVVFVLAGCDQAPLGARCENNVDCDRSSAPTVACVSFSNPAQMCAGADCICCPIDTAARQAVAVCLPHGTGSTGGRDADTVTVDSAPVATPDTAVAEAATPEASFPPDAAVDVVLLDGGADASCACTPGVSYCVGGTCAPVRMLGQGCSAASECGTGFCVTGVCCNSACTGSDVSCAVSSNFAGVCMFRPLDAGTDANTAD